PGGNQHVASTTLWHAHDLEVQHSTRHRVPGRLERPSRRGNDSGAIPLNWRHVFDHNDVRLQDFRCSRHLQVEGVLWSAASRMVVKVGMTLTGWSALQNVDIAKRIDESAFRIGHRCANLAIEKSSHIASEAVGAWKVSLEDLENLRVIVHCQDRLKSQAM